MFLLNLTITLTIVLTTSESTSDPISPDHIESFEPRRQFRRQRQIRQGSDEETHRDISNRRLVGSPTLPG
jgi:hypothetical protein